MHLRPRYINILISILLGAAWAFALYGFVTGFTSISANIFVKLFSAFLHSLVGLFFVLLLEAIYTIFKIREHQIKKKQE